MTMTYISSTEVRCTTASAPTPISGRVSLTTVSGGSASSAVNFTYFNPSAIAPTVTSLVPSTGSTEGGFYVSVYGVSFGDTPSTVKSISVGTATASEVIFHNSGFIECTFPPHPEGTASVAVVPAITGGPPPVRLGFLYNYPAPVLENARPRLSVGFSNFFV
jgi:hypothetical protein